MKRTVAVITSVLLCLTLMLSVNADKLSPDGLIKVACVGDSITQGTGTIYEGVYAWPALLQDMLDSDKYNVGNFGVSGTTAIENLGASYRKTDLYTQSIDFQPNIVILMLGTNDVYDGHYSKFNSDFEKDFTSLIQTYQNLESKPEVYVCTAPFCSEDTTRPERITNELIGKQKAIAESLNCKIVDVYTFTKDLQQHFNDGLHPNNEGNVLMAKFFAQEIFGAKFSKVILEIPSTATAYLQGDKGEEAVADGYKTASFDVGVGRHDFIIADNGEYYLARAFATDTDMTVDCKSLSVLDNIATSSSFTDNDASASAVQAADGDMNTGWQLDNANYRNGKNLSIFLTASFNAPTQISGVTVFWENASRCASDGYTLEYTENGTDWFPVKNEVRGISAMHTDSISVDCIAFDTVNAMQLRINCNYSGNYKGYSPKIFELELHSSSPLVKLATAEPIVSEPVNSDGESSPLTVILICIGAAVLLAAVAVAVILVVNKKK